MSPRRIMRRRRERIHQRPPDPAEEADRPLEEPPAGPSRFPKRDEPGEAGPPDEPPHHRLSHPIDEPDETSDSDPYDHPREPEP